MKRNLSNLNIPVPEGMREEVMKAASEDFCSVAAWVRRAIARQLAVLRAVKRQKEADKRERQREAEMRRKEAAR